jgi:hypothetical protein
MPSGAGSCASDADCAWCTYSRAGAFGRSACEPSRDTYAVPRSQCSEIEAFWMRKCGESYVREHEASVAGWHPPAMVCGPDAKCWTFSKPLSVEPAAGACRWEVQDLFAQVDTDGGRLLLEGADAVVGIVQGQLAAVVRKPIEAIARLAQAVLVTREDIDVFDGTLHLPAGTWLVGAKVDPAAEQVSGIVVLSESPFVGGLDSVRLPCKSLRPRARRTPPDPGIITEDKGAVWASWNAKTTPPLPPARRHALDLHAGPSGPSAGRLELEGIPLRVEERRGTRARVIATWPNGAKLAAWVPAVSSRPLGSRRSRARRAPAGLRSSASA